MADCRICVRNVGAVMSSLAAAVMYSCFRFVAKPTNLQPTVRGGVRPDHTRTIVTRLPG